MEFSVRTQLPRRFLEGDPTGIEYYVSPGGDDNNPGTRDSPFCHIQRCAETAQPGDTCLVSEGTYRETVFPESSERVRDPIKYVAYSGAKVTLSGTELVTGEWTPYKGSIYQIKVDFHVDQLFVDGQMMIGARWPNMRFEEIWERSCWANTTKGVATEKSLIRSWVKRMWTGQVQLALSMLRINS